MFFPPYQVTVRDEILIDVIKRVLFEEKGASVDELAKTLLYELEQKIYEIYKRKDR